MATKIITCPSGLQGEIRNLKAKEISTIAGGGVQVRSGKKGKGKRSHPLDPVFVGCWLKTGSPGPYSISEGTPVPWPKVLMCDRFFTLLHIRDLTWGPYEFKTKCRTHDCEYGPRTKKRFVWAIDLNLLEFKPLPEASIVRVREDRLVFELEVAGRKCSFRLLRGEDEANMPALADDEPDDKKLLAQVASRLFRVEGIDDEDDDARIDWVGELDARDLWPVSKEMDAVDGGVETRTVVQCESCEEEFTVDIPFGDPAFLAPTRT